MDVIEGAYALVILTQKKLVGIRDPWGMRPLCIGKMGNSYVLASENCAFDAIGADFIRDVEPGEMIFIEDGSLKSIKTNYKNRINHVFLNISILQDRTVL